MKLENNKPSGFDNIPVKFLKTGCLEVSVILSAIINDMMCQGVFPPQLKTAVITPIYKKKGEENNARNYHPISILPSIAKLIEKIIFKTFGLL